MMAAPFTPGKNDLGTHQVEGTSRVAALAHAGSHPFDGDPHHGRASSAPREAIRDAVRRLLGDPG
jgi:hypothetical protein